MSRLLKLAALAWVGRWLALELAAHLGGRRPRGPAPVSSKRPPGWMPGPRDLL